MAVKIRQQEQFTRLNNDFVKTFTGIRERIELFILRSDPLFGFKEVKTDFLTPDELELFKTALKKYEQMRKEYREPLAKLITALAAKAVTQSQYNELALIPAYDYGMIEANELVAVNKVLLVNNHFEIEISREPEIIPVRRISMQSQTINK